VTRFLLIRHTAHDYLGRGIPGRLANVHLNDTGRAEAKKVARALSRLSFDAIYSSPLERARETAEPLANALNLPIRIAEEFTELEMGEWTDRRFAELAGTTQWQAFNTFRSCVRAPGGEMLLAAQARMIGKMLELRPQHACVGIFSHGDPIRAALTYFLGMPIDLYARIEIDPGGISLVELGEDFVRVRWLNVLGEAQLLPPG
jgi:probable phosphoglycerate mutase